MQPVEIITIIVAVAIVVGVITGTIVKKVRNKKKGITGCCCGCSDCPHGKTCLSAKQRGTEK